jgi:hypothetical protein
MKEIICTVLSLFLSLSSWVNAWPQQLPVSGSSEKSLITPILPKISVSPTSVNFGNLNPGGTSESVVTIKNSGKADLVISSIAISGNNPSDFSQTNHCITMPGGSSCAVAVTFGPTSGGKKSATLSIASNDPKKPTINVKLSGSARSPVCSYSLSSSSQQCDASGGTWSFDVNTSNGCNWTATTRTSWITITSGSSGSGNGTVAYRVTPNTSTRQRTGKLTISKQTFTVTQSGAGPSCIYSISATNQNFDSTGGTGSVGVTAQSGCNWTAMSNAGWISITSGGNGSGNGSVGYSVSANPTTSQRTGTMTIAGQTFTVTQSPCLTPGTPSGPSPLNDATGVSTSPTLSWAAVSNTDSYDVYLGTSSNPTYAGNTTNTNYRPSGLTSDTTYSWKVVAKNNCGNSTPGLVWSFTTGSAPIYTPSEYQQALLDNYGAPDYLSVIFGPDAPGRQETWVYADLQKIYLFWDGESLGSTGIAIDPKAYSNPPYLDPSFFTKDTTLSDLEDLLGDYTEVDQSYFSSVIGDAKFKTYFFKDEGLVVAFLDDNLVSVQTVDIPEGNTPVSSIITSLLPRKVPIIPISRRQQDIPIVEARELTPVQVVIGLAALIITRLVYPDFLITDQKFWDECNGALGTDLAKHKACTEAIQKEMEAKWFFNVIICMFVNIIKGEDVCKEKIAPPAAFQSVGGLAGAGGDEFIPICPGEGIRCAGYAYSDWSGCGPDGKQTRTATNIPAGCNIEPPVPPEETTRSCPCTDYTYSDWWACAADGIQTRAVTGYIPPGCSGFPPNPPVTTQSCTPSQPCTGYAYSDWSACGPDGIQTRAVMGYKPDGCSGIPPNPPVTTQSCTPPCTSYTSSESACQQNVWWMGINGLGTITTTYTGVPSGCVGGISIPPPTTRCCDGFNPC